MKVTKDSFAKTVTKVVPVVGGVVSDGMTLFSLSSRSFVLQQHRRKLPPLGMDAAEYSHLLSESSFDDESISDRARTAVADAAQVGAEGAKAMADESAEGARRATAGASAWLRGIAGAKQEETRKD